MLTESHAYESIARDSNWFMLKGAIVATVLGISALWAFKGYESSNPNQDYSMISIQKNIPTRTQISGLER